MQYSSHGDRDRDRRRPERSFRSGDDYRRYDKPQSGNDDHPRRGKDDRRHIRVKEIDEMPPIKKFQSYSGPDK